MGRPKENLIGQKFGRWTVVEEGPGYIDKGANGIKPNWYCDCDCGTKHHLVSSKNLKAGNSKSCGCLARENISKANRKYNTYDLSGKFGKGYDSNGNEFWFDLDDYAKIKEYYWQKFNNGYFVSLYRDNGKTKTIQLHRLILRIQNEDWHTIVADHINGKAYDNRKKNLRVANRSQNCSNISLRKDNTSGVTGVYWHKGKNKWIASIHDIPGHSKELGAFTSFEEAVQARKEGEIKYYGEFGRG